MEPIRGRGDLIDGAFALVPSEGASLLESRDPARDFALNFTVRASSAHVEAAVAAARKAQRGWFACGLQTRKAQLERLKGVFQARVEGIADAIVRETGKPHREALGEARSLAARVDLMIGEGLFRVAPLRPEPGSEARVHPQGVVAVLGPYNYPAHLVNAHVIPALLTGNTVVMKPSEHCPWTGELYASCFVEAGLPAGVVNLVQGKGDVGRALVQHAGVDAILFTGSYGTGRAIQEAVLDQPHKLVALEMGGKNCAVVLEDADVLQALAAVLQGAYLTTGQRCTATSRVLVHQRLFERFTDALVAATRELLPGDPWRDDVPFGPLANLPGFERFLRVQALATASGLEALVPGRTLEGGAFVTPSIHLLPQGHPDPTGYLDEELFGPDLCVERIDDDDHAIARLNESPYGLSNAIFTTRPDRFERFFHETRSGLLNHNRSTNGASGKLPFGGVGRSGNQRPAGIDAMRYTTFPVAVLRAEPGDAPVEAPFRDAVGAGRSLLGVGLERLIVRQRVEGILERYRVPIDDVRGPDVLVPLPALRALRLEGAVLDGQRLVERLEPYARIEQPHLVVTAPAPEGQEAFCTRLKAVFDQVARENPIHTAGYPAPGVSRPSGGQLPRSEALLRRMYQADFVPREKKTAVIDLSRSEGAFLRSVDEDPLALVDSASQIASLGLGFQPGVFLRALDEGDVGPWLLGNLDTAAPFTDAKELDEYAGFLLSKAWPGLMHCSFTSGGSEANEKAFDLCRLHGPGGRRVIAFEGSYHGRTLAALHATWSPTKRRAFELPGYEATFVPFPAWPDPREEPPVDDAWIKAWARGEAVHEDASDPVLKAEVQSLLRVRGEVERGDVCAVIVEPMQGEGGDNYGTARFFQGLRALTRYLGVPLIVDEVQTGFGLGGEFFWHRRFRLRDQEGRIDGPDCVTLAKKAQLGVCLSAWQDLRPQAAHVVQAVRGLYHGQALVELSPREIEATVRDALWTLAVDYPSLILSPRNQGWAFSFDLPSNHLANQVVNQRFYRGFMAYIAGERTVRFRLNAAWTSREVSTLFAGLRASLDAIADAARESPPEEQLAAMQSYVAPPWDESARLGGRRDETTRRFPGEYERLSADPPALLRWLLALPRGPLERVCDRILAMEGQLADERVEVALRALTRARAHLPGTGQLLEKVRQVLEEIERSPDRRAAYKQQEQRLGMAPARLIIESIGARVVRVAADEWERIRADVLAIESATYEEGRRDSEPDLRRMLEDDGGLGLVLRRRTDHGDRILGYAFGGPVERYNADGPKEDPMRGTGNTFYSANITVAANERGAGLGLRLKRAQVRLVSSIQREDKSPRYVFMTGRNRVGRTRQMAGINHAFGAYAVEYFRGNQYGDKSGEALYYRVPLRRPQIMTGLPGRADGILDWASGIQAPLGPRPEALRRALEEGDFTNAVGTKLTLSNFVTPTVVRYAELLRQLAPRGLCHTYFTSGRDELVDKGLRCLKLQRKEADVVIGLERQFLGTTTAAARSLTDPMGHQQPFGWYDWPLVPHPAEVGTEATLEAIRAAIGRVCAERVLAVVVELTGERSGLSLPPGFVAQLANLRKETGIPFVVVETSSALGRLGKHLFASDGLSARPSMIWWYCGAQLGHIFCDDATWVSTPLQLISTWDGDEISIVRTRHHLLEAREALRHKRGERFAGALEEALHGRVPLRGRGLLWALDLEDEGRAQGLIERGKEQGLRLTRGLGARVMVVPPVNLGDAEIEEGIGRLKRALEGL
jgi:succinylglutamic semialdehyde dehydrogenase